MLEKQENFEIVAYRVVRGNWKECKLTTKDAARFRVTSVLFESAMYTDHEHLGEAKRHVTQLKKAYYQGQMSVKNAFCQLFNLRRF